jgi:hypothetical protein
VHQNTLTIPFTTLCSLLAALYHVTLAPRLPGHSSSFDVLLLNGPGTCVVLCVAAYVNRVGPVIPARMNALLTGRRCRFAVPGTDVTETRLC